ncbi:hypothetical protein XspCFBP7912_09455 [Xanthomonas sp. CFBP 7912]|nr:hypothetical protein XspCFBP7912_09455 [Xanthomonas sp. CFBP 7912]RJS02461.1 hypothetical protein XnspCFBP7698_16070 [Xanthomonas sp. CFBP 7698]
MAPRQEEDFTYAKSTQVHLPCRDLLHEALSRVGRDFTGGDSVYNFTISAQDNMTGWLMF